MDLNAAGEKHCSGKRGAPVQRTGLGEKTQQHVARAHREVVNLDVTGGQKEAFFGVAVAGPENTVVALAGHIGQRNWMDDHDVGGVGTTGQDFVRMDVNAVAGGKGRWVVV